MNAVLARWDRETSVVVTNHGMTSQSAPDWIQRAYRPIARYVFEMADRVFCYTETDVKRLRERGTEAETAVILNGIDVNRFAPDVTAHWEELAADGDRPYLLFVGRLHPGKAVDNLLDAFSTIRDEIPHHVLIVGTARSRGTRTAGY